MQIKIEKATFDDANWIVSQLRDFSTTYPTKLNLFADEDYAASSVEIMIAHHVCFVAWKDGERVGFIAGYLTEHPFNPSIRVLTETFWWVIPTHRGCSAGLKLLNKFTEHGRENADWIIMAIIENKTPVSSESLSKRGYRLHERAFLMEC